MFEVTLNLIHVHFAIGILLALIFNHWYTNSAGKKDSYRHWIVITTSITLVLVFFWPIIICVIIIGAIVDGIIKRGEKDAH
jgi:ABC-type transport system involved in multi-copper enzyme maturation permease subunit